MFGKPELDSVLLIIGIILVAVGVFLWSNSATLTPVYGPGGVGLGGVTTTVVTDYITTRTDMAGIGLGIAAIGLGSAVTGIVLLIKKQA